MTDPDIRTYTGIAISGFGPVYVAWRDVEKGNRSRRWKRAQLIIGTLMGLVGALIAAWGSSASSRQESALITGGDSFCYLTVFGYPTDQPIVPIIIVAGDYPLYDLEYRIYDLDEPLQPRIVNGQEVGLGTTYSAGNMPPQSTRLVGTTFPVKPGTRRFNIFFVARNGFFNEALRLVPDQKTKGGSWLKAIQVTKNNKVVLESIDPTFPRGPDGTVQW